MATWLERSGNRGASLYPGPPTTVLGEHQSLPVHRLETASGPGKSLGRGWAASAQAEVSALMSVGLQSWSLRKKPASLHLLVL